MRAVVEIPFTTTTTHHVLMKVSGALGKQGGQLQMACNPAKPGPKNPFAFSPYCPGRSRSDTRKTASHHETFWGKMCMDVCVCVCGRVPSSNDL